jgi:hypothetical protein
VTICSTYTAKDTKDAKHAKDTRTESGLDLDVDVPKFGVWPMFLHEEDVEEKVA